MNKYTIKWREPCTTTITVGTISALYLYNLSYSYFTFLQFRKLEIITVSIIFTSIFLIISKIFNNKNENINYKLSSNNILYIVIVSFIFIMFSNSFGNTFSDYIRTFPILETDMGLGWNKDTVFHVSLIQSILNFGYPSTAQNGAPFTGYHALSHYIDAAILFFSKVDPYESYGLFNQFKIFAILSSILIIINESTKKSGVLLYLISILIFTPIAIGTWHVVGSHGLWMTSIILILSSNFVYNIITKETRISNLDCFHLLIIMVLISFGKISSGIMFSSFVGSALLLKEYKSYKPYLIGFLYLLFLSIYQEKVGKSFGVSVTYDITKISFDSAYSFISNPTMQIKSILISILILTIIAYTKKNRHNLVLLFSAILSLILLYASNKINPEFGKSDIWYLQYGLSFTLIIYTYKSIIEIAIETATETSKPDKSKETKKLVNSGLFVAMLFISYNNFLPNFNIFNMGPESVKEKLTYANLNPFLSVNKKLTNGDKISIIKSIKKRPKHLLKTQPKILEKFKSNLDEIINQKKLAKRETGLFIPKSIFNDEIKKLGGLQWANGLLIYASTGVPLLYGIDSLKRGYGFGDYSKDDFRRDLQDFSPEKECATRSLSAIVITEQFNPPKFKVVDCPLK